MKLHTGRTGQRPHVDPPSVAAQDTCSPCRRDTAVSKVARSEQLHPETL